MPAKYRLAYLLYKRGLSKWYIAKILYPNKPVCKAELMVNALIRYAERKQARQNNNNNNMVDEERVYVPGNYMSQVEPLYTADDLDHERQVFNNIHAGKPLSRKQYNVVVKSSLPYHEQVRKDLEEVLWHYHQLLGLHEPVSSHVWGMVKHVNNVLYRVYNNRAGSAGKPYPRLLAYVFVVFFVALHKHYPHLVHRVHQQILSTLATKRARRRFQQYVQEFLGNAGHLLLSQYM